MAEYVVVCLTVFGLWIIIYMYVECTFNLVVAFVI